MVAACVLWTGLELWGDNQIWAMLALCISLYAAHQFFIAFDPQEPTETSDEHSSRRNRKDFLPAHQTNLHVIADAIATEY